MGTTMPSAAMKALMAVYDSAGGVSMTITSYSSRTRSRLAFRTFQNFADGSLSCIVGRLNSAEKRNGAAGTRSTPAQ